MKQFLVVLSSILGGIVFGLGVAFFFVHTKSSAPVPAVSTVPASQPVAADPYLSDLLPKAAPERDVKVEQLEARLRKLETIRSPEQAQTALQAQAPSAEEQRQLIIESHDRSVAQFHAERVDRGWASTTEDRIRSSADLLSKQAAYEVISIDCRTTMCLLTLQWDNYKAALSGAEMVATHDFGPRCTREVTLPINEDPARPVRVTSVMDCRLDR